MRIFALSARTLLGFALANLLLACTAGNFTSTSGEALSAPMSKTQTIIQLNPVSPSNESPLSLAGFFPVLYEGQSLTLEPKGGTGPYFVEVEPCRVDNQCLPPDHECATPSAQDPLPFEALPALHYRGTHLAELRFPQKAASRTGEDEARVATNEAGCLGVLDLLVTDARGVELRKRIQILKP